jgi:hypothetical protein
LRLISSGHPGEPPEDQGIVLPINDTTEAVTLLGDEPQASNKRLL